MPSIRDEFLRKRLKSDAHGIGGGRVSNGKNYGAETRAQARNWSKSHSDGIGGGLVLSGKNCAEQTFGKNTFPESTVGAVILETH